jgi:hypothetical protein
MPDTVFGVSKLAVVASRLVGGVIAAPLAMPILPVDLAAKYCRFGTQTQSRWRMCRSQICGSFLPICMAGRSRCRHGASLQSLSTQERQRCALPQPILSPDDAAGTEGRQGRDGSATGGFFVLDAASGMGLSAVARVRFVRGAARKSRWCAVEHRAN